MDTSTWILIGAAVIVIAVVVTMSARQRAERRRRTDALRERFGPEYDIAVREHGVRDAERELDDRLDRASRAAVRPLSPEDDARFHDEWERIQARVIDAPTRAVVDAERLLQDAMETRGYAQDVRGRVDLLSVLHPAVAQDYRDAHQVAVSALDGHANTEACRQALLRYRRLFDVILIARIDDGTERDEERRERLDLRDRAQARATAGTRVTG